MKTKTKTKKKISFRNREIEKVPFRSKLTKYRNIENRNEAFEALTKKEQRQEIAYDALKLVHSGIVSASYGSYWGDDVNKIVNPAKTSKELQTCLINLKDKTCTVCQRGLMMVSQIRLANTIDPFDSKRADGDSDNIKGFNYNDFLFMENEFEQSFYGHSYESNTNKKLANICCNIIANGNFKVSDKTDYLTKWKLNIK